MGTIDYIAPEQIQGRPVDGRADIYSLGCVLYECLTGRVPFAKDVDAAVIWAHVEEMPTTPSSLQPTLPPGIDQVMGKALAKDPADRYATCREFIAAARGAPRRPPAATSHRRPADPLHAPATILGPAPPPPPLPTRSPATAAAARRRPPHDHRPPAKPPQSRRFRRPRPPARHPSGHLAARRPRGRHPAARSRRIRLDRRLAGRPERTGAGHRRRRRLADLPQHHRRLPHPCRRRGSPPRPLRRASWKLGAASPFPVQQLHAAVLDGSRIWLAGGLTGSSRERPPGQRTRRSTTTWRPTPGAPARGCRSRCITRCWCPTRSAVADRWFPARRPRTWRRPPRTRC